MKRRMIKVVAALASACMVASSFAGAAFAAEGDGSTPRNETLYFAGQQWGAINDWNPMSANSNNAMGIQQKDATRTLIYDLRDTVYVQPAGQQDVSASWYRVFLG